VGERHAVIVAFSRGWLALPFLKLFYINVSMPPARLLRDVPEKAEGFLFGALCGIRRAAIFCTVMTLVGRARLGKPSFFQTHHAAGGECWNVVSLLIL
jgi:hypothetical protein